MGIVKVSGKSATYVGKVDSAIVAAISGLEGPRRANATGLRFEATPHNLDLFEGLGIRVEREAAPVAFDPASVPTPTPGGAAFESFAGEIERPRKSAPERPRAALDAIMAPWKSIPEWQSPYPRKTTPLPHQAAARTFIGNRKTIALFMEQGTGKTKADIDWTDDLYRAGEITGWIIVTRNGVHRQWADSELPKHMANDFEVRWWGEKGNHLPAGGKGLEILTINWDGIKTKAGKAWLLQFCERHEGRLKITADEAQDMKNARSERHKVMMELKPYSSHRAVLTGTPIAKDLVDEWAILRWLDESILKTKYVTTFRREFCIMGGFQNRAVVGHRNLERFRQLTAPAVFRVRKVDIGLLPKQYAEWTFDLTPRQKDLLKALKKEAKARLESGEEVKAPEAAQYLIKAQQISNGFAVDEDGQTIRLFEPGKNPRISAALDWIRSEDDTKAIVWARFREDIAILGEALEEAGISFARYLGGLSLEDKGRSIDDFLDPKGVRILIATDAASTGLNLQGGCNRALYYSEGFNAVNRWQKEDRIDRIGTIGFTVHTDLIAKGGVDRNIMNNRKRKEGVSAAAIDGLPVEGFSGGQSEALEILSGFLGEE